MISMFKYHAAGLSFHQKSIKNFGQQAIQLMNFGMNHLTKKTRSEEDVY